MIDQHSTQEIASASLSILLADHYSEPPGYRIQRPSGLKDWFVTFTHAGQGRYLWADSKYVCSRGDLVVLPSGFPQDYGTATDDKNWEHYWVHFTPQPKWLRWLFIPDTQLKPYICHISDSVSETRAVLDFERLLKCYREGQHASAENAFEDVLLVTVQQYAQAVCGNIDKRVVRIVQYMFQHLDGEIDVPMLAELVAMSTSRLSHLFNELMHTSIMHMLGTMRLEYAIRLLRFTTLSIGEISDEAGFQSQFYFSRRFKMHYAVGPREYRKQLNQF